MLMAKNSKIGYSGRNPIRKKVIRADDVPVNRKMLYSVRDELKSDILSVRSEMTSLHENFNALRAEMTGAIHKVALLVEEQNSRNVIVLDGLNVLFHRQEQIEKEFSAKG